MCGDPYHGYGLSPDLAKHLGDHGLSWQKIHILTFYERSQPVMGKGATHHLMRPSVVFGAQKVDYTGSSWVVNRSGAT